MDLFEDMRKKGKIKIAPITTDLVSFTILSDGINVENLRQHLHK